MLVKQRRGSHGSGAPAVELQGGPHRFASALDPRLDRHDEPEVLRLRVAETMPERVRHIFTEARPIEIKATTARATG